MCGVLGIVAKNKFSVSYLMNGLKNLEYRGYDSLGLTFMLDNSLRVYKSIGTVEEFKLEHNLILNTNILAGIAHTRWATHGGLTKKNAHPHFIDGMAIVHNGIVDNYKDIIDFIYENKPDVKFHSDTDTEVIVQLINLFYSENKDIIVSIDKAIKMMKGVFSFLLFFEDDCECIYAYCGGNSLVISNFDDKYIIASDTSTISHLCDEAHSIEVSNLIKGDTVKITSSNYSIFRNSQVVFEKYVTYSVLNDIGNITSNNILNNAKDTIFLQEIYSQPDKICDTFYNAQHEILYFLKFLKQYNEFTIVACGSSYIMSFIIKEWFANHTNIIVHSEIASEIRLRKNYKNRAGLYIFVSQSGETADTIAALEYIKGENNICIAVVNTKHSSLSIIADFTIHTNAGTEKSVAATKTFTTQMIVFQLILSLYLKEKDSIFYDNQKNIFSHKYLNDIFYNSVFNMKDNLQNIAKDLKKSNNMLFIGRGSCYGLAMEGALKFKEITYIHADAIPAGELKHGTLALVDSKLPVISIIPYNEYFNKTYSNICEINARGGKIIALTDLKGSIKLKNIAKKIIILPEMDEFLSPFIYVTVLQLLSYYIAKERKTNIDRPRNLAKSVTVE